MSVPGVRRAGAHYAFWGAAPQLLASVMGLKHGSREPIAQAGRLLSAVLHLRHALPSQRPWGVGALGSISWSEQMLPVTLLWPPTPESMTRSWSFLMERPRCSLLYTVFLAPPSFWLKWTFSGKAFLKILLIDWLICIIIYTFVSFNPWFGLL